MLFASYYSLISRTSCFDATQQKVSCSKSTIKKRCEIRERHESDIIDLDLMSLSLIFHTYSSDFIVDFEQVNVWSVWAFKIKNIHQHILSWSEIKQSNIFSNHSTLCISYKWTKISALLISTNLRLSRGRFVSWKLSTFLAAFIIKH